MRVAAVLVAALAMFAAENRAFAQYSGQELGGGVQKKDISSPQHFAIEFRFAPYKPLIDSAPGVSGAPYQSTFGTAFRFLPSLEVDWQALHIPHLGSIGLGVAGGYTAMGAPARFTTCPPAPASCVSGENTSLAVFPFYAVVVLRADVLMKDFGIPLVPYAKGGVGLAFWRASNDAGTSSYNGIEGHGHSWGTQFALGLALSLNWLDVKAARSLDDSAGINNTSIFAEWMFSTLNGFGAKDTLWVGTSTWVAGLSFEF